MIIHASSFIYRDNIFFSLDGKTIIKNQLQAHSKVSAMLKILGATHINTFLQNLQDPDHIQLIVQNRNDPSQIFCSTNHLTELFNTIDPTELSIIKDQLCSTQWNEFLQDVLEALGILEIEDITRNIKIQTQFFNERGSNTLQCLYKNCKKVLKYIKEDLTSNSEWDQMDGVLDTLRLRVLQNVVQSLDIKDENVKKIVKYLEIFVEDIVQKLQILFVKDGEDGYLRLDPYLDNEVGEVGEENLLWKRYIIQEKRLVATLKYLFKHKIDTLDFINYEHFQQIWKNNMDLETGLELR